MFEKGKMKKLWMVFLVVSVMLGLSACASEGTGSNIPYASIPAGMGYAEGEEIFFSHTEASDAAVAEKLTNMMKSPVLVVPSLAQIPTEFLAPVYVFENGVNGKGPLGYQADVFPFPPGTDGYTPLREITFVKWTDPNQTEILKSAQEVLDAEKDGKVTLQSSGVVVNMPFMTWKGDQR